VSSSYLRNRISVRATTLMLLHGVRHGHLMPREQAQRLAARELAAERRASAKPSAAPPPTVEPTIANARAVLIARVMAVSERLKAAPRRRKRLGAVDLPTIGKSPPEVILRHTADLAPINSPQPAPAPELVVGVFVGRVTAAELIDDAEFEPRWRAQSQATENWRNSIQANERIAARRRGLWVG
jgi:hypothetical protein